MIRIATYDADTDDSIFYRLAGYVVGVSTVEKYDAGVEDSEGVYMLANGISWDEDPEGLGRPMFGAQVYDEERNAPDPSGALHYFAVDDHVITVY